MKFSIILNLILSIIINSFLTFNKIKAYSIKDGDDILNVYGISQNPDTKDYIMVLEYAEGGNLNKWTNDCTKRDNNWKHNMNTLICIIRGLEKIHEKQMVHRDFHTGNILSLGDSYVNIRYGIMWRSW